MARQTFTIPRQARHVTFCCWACGGGGSRLVSGSPIRFLPCWMCNGDKGLTIRLGSILSLGVEQTGEKLFDAALTPAPESADA